ncbi:DUF1534 domain-containing protein [Pseudomonas syringae UB303]|uniref:DUF1534 domain-containing protein n=1 Tax=Pseudomonas syringae UB303 TaxID=1357287 RepID=A0AAJ4B5I2_PSESX|nr:DUF1534 domain-containing protein [Pseudomonas syringae UB303]
MFRPGRGASRTAYPRGAWVRWCLPGHLTRYPFRDLPDGYRSSRSRIGMPFVTLRVTSAPRRMFRPGRGASRTAYPRGAWVRWCLPGHLAR